MSSTLIQLASIQSNQITSLTKLCSNALVLVDQITFEWFRMINLIGHLFCSLDHPTIKRINDEVNYNQIFSLLDSLSFEESI